MIFGTNTTRDISKFSNSTRLTAREITISKYHWYLCQISLKIMLLPIQIGRDKFQLDKKPQRTSLVAPFGKVSRRARVAQ